MRNNYGFYFLSINKAIQDDLMRLLPTALSIPNLLPNENQKQDDNKRIKIDTLLRGEEA